MTTRHQDLRREFDRHQDLRHEFDRLQSSAQEVCSCVRGSPPSSPLQDELRRVPRELVALTAIAAYHGASIALSAMVLRHPELDLAGLEDDLSGGKPFVAKMASHAIFQYNVLAIDDTHNTWTNMIVKINIPRLFRFK